MGGKQAVVFFLSVALLIVSFYFSGDLSVLNNVARYGGKQTGAAPIKATPVKGKGKG